MIRSVLAGFGVVALLVLTGVNGSAAQTLTEGSLQGMVRVAQGGPPGSVVLTLRDRATGATRTVPLNGLGRFHLPKLRPGLYDLTAEAFGMRPQRLEAIEVRAGANTRVETVLAPSENPDVPLEVRRYGGSAGGGTQQFHAVEWNRLPLAGRDLSALAQLATNSNGSLDTEGLPGTLSGLRIDGLPTGLPVRAGGALPVLPLSAFSQATILNVDADVEWSGTAAPALSLLSAGAGSRTELRGYGAWLNGPAHTDNLAAPVSNGIQAGALLSGPFIQDTAAYVFGLEVWRLETPLAVRAGADSVAARAAAIARDIYGVPSAGLPQPRLAQLNAASGFGRLEWRLGDEHTLRTSGAFSSLPRVRTAPRTLDRSGAQSEMQGLDAHFASTLTSNLAETVSQEFRIGWDRTSRDFNEAQVAFGEGSTLFVQDNVGLGRDPAQIGEFATSTFRLYETVHVRGATHHAKLGLSADVASHDFTYRAQRTGSFWYSTTDFFAGGAGYGIATSGEARAQFRVPRLGVFLQDEWSIGSSMQIRLGLRWDLDVAPTDDIKPDTTWFRLTGIGPDTSRSRHGRVSPRFEIEWRPAARWSLRASGGIWDAPFDPVLFGEALANDGRVKVDRGFGSFEDWPQAPVDAARPTLTLLPEGFQGPRSTRGALQLSRSLASGLDLVVSGTYRRTEFLPRRADLNLTPTAGLRDQYNREVYGTLQQSGGVVAAAAGSNRRFSAYDVVSAIGVDGWSEYLGADAMLSAQLSDVLQLRGRYTFSSTEDNWFMARSSGGLGELSPFRAGSGADWTEGISDFDVPHRATLGATLSLPGFRGLQFAALYRYRSGYPFTPGYPDGVDVNGDGSLRNDPAYVDPGSPDFATLAASWPCLRENQGRVAARNSCRAPSAGFFDARVSFGITSGSGRGAELIVDALNLITTGAAEVDRALYRVDAGGTLTIDQANGRVHVPFMLNPNFGAPLLRATAPRTLRVGLRVTY